MSKGRAAPGCLTAASQLPQSRGQRALPTLGQWTSSDLACILGSIHPVKSLAKRHTGVLFSLQPTTLPLQDPQKCIV